MKTNKCPMCGEEYQFGSFRKDGWSFLSIHTDGNFLEIWMHEENESGGSCSNIRVGKNKFLEYIKKVVEDG